MRQRTALILKIDPEKPPPIALLRNRRGLIVALDGCFRGGLFLNGFLCLRVLWFAYTPS